MKKKTLIKRNKTLTHMLVSQLFWTVICLAYIDQHIEGELTGAGHTIALFIATSSIFHALYILLDDIDALLSGIFQRHEKPGKHIEKRQDPQSDGEGDPADNLSDIKSGTENDNDQYR